jgi:hypothetical protein
MITMEADQWSTELCALGLIDVAIIGLATSNKNNQQTALTTAVVRLRRNCEGADDIITPF